MLIGTSVSREGEAPVEPHGADPSNDVPAAIAMRTMPPTDFPPGEYERRLARRRDEAALRLTKLASISFISTPVSLGLTDDIFPTSASFFDFLFALIAALPAGAAAGFTLYDWSVLPRGKIVLGLLPWSLLVLGTTLIVLGMF